MGVGRGKSKKKIGYIKAAIAKIKVNKMEKMEVIENKEKNSITYYKTLDSKGWFITFRSISKNW